MLGFGNQQRVKDAAAVAVFCADLEPRKRVDRVYQSEVEAGARTDGYLAVMRVASAFLTGDGAATAQRRRRRTRRQPRSPRGPGRGAAHQGARRTNSRSSRRNAMPSKWNIQNF